MARKGILVEAGTVDAAYHRWANTRGQDASAEPPRDSRGLPRTHAYDAFGRPSQSQTTIAMQSFTTGVTYDLAGRVETQTCPSGFVVRHQYTASGALERLTDRRDKGARVEILSVSPWSSTDAW